MAEGEMVNIRRRLTAPLRDRRRMFAIAALVLGLTAAWWQARDDSAEVLVSLLLTHAQVQVGETTIPYQGLREVILRVPASDPGQPPVWRMALNYTPGQVPKVTRAIALDLPAEVEDIEVGCVFALGAGSPLRTWTNAPVQRQRTDLQVVDIDTCGDLEGTTAGQ